MKIGLQHHPVIFLLAFTSVLTGFRFWYASSLGLAPDEAYYWTWSQNLSLHYPDHPPMIAWLIASGTRLAGNSELGIRLSSILLGAVSVFLVYFIARKVDLSRRCAALAGGLSTVLPATSTGAILATPDSFLATCWLATTLLIFRLSKKTEPLSWYLIGALTGLALYAKHTALLIPATVLIVAFLKEPFRKSLRTSHPYLAAVLCILVAFPYLQAEALSDFSSFSFQGSHLGGGLPGANVSLIQAPLRWLEILGGQAGLLSLLVAFWTAVFIFKKRSREWSYSPLAIMIVAPIAATMAAAVFTHPEQNWAALGSPLASVATIKILSTRPNFKNHLIATALVAVLFSSLIHAHAMMPFLPLPPKKDPVARLHGWDQLPIAIPKKLHTVVCDNYGLASELKWNTRLQPDPKKVYSTDRPASKPAKGNWLLLDELQDYGNQGIRADCERIEPLDSISLRRHDRKIVRRVAVSIGYECK